MVSVSGYILGEYIVMIIATYALIVIASILQYMVDVIEDRTLLRTSIIGGVSIIAVFLYYLTAVRFGMIMLLNGIAIGIIVKNAIIVIKHYLKENEDGQERNYQ